jgi:hypothetical protein
MRFTRFRTESDHAALDKLVAAYLDRGGVIRRDRDSYVTVTCGQCYRREQVSSYVSKWGIRCRCGAPMRT